MSKIFELNVAKGSMIDKVNSVVPVNTNCIIKKGEKGRHISFDATTDLDSYGVISGVKTVEIWLRTSGDTKILQDDGTDKLEISGGDITGTGLTQCYVNNVDTDAVTSNQWQQVIAEFSGGIDFATDLEIDTTAGIDIVTVILDSEIYSAIKRHNQYNAFLRSSNISSPLTLKQKVQHKAVEQESSLVLFHNYENNNSLDLTNNNNDGVDTAIDYGVDGARLNGLNSLITVADDDSLSFGNGSSDSPFSIEWFGKVNITNDGVIITKREDATTKYEYLLYLFEPSGTQTRLLFRMYDQSATAYIGRFFATTGNDLYNGKEIHIIATYTGNGESSGVEIWLNGNKVDNADSYDGNYIAMENLTAPLFIGANGLVPTAYSNSDYKNVKIYGKVLSDNEIAQKYNSIAKQVVFNEDMTNQDADEITYTVGKFIGDLQVVSGSFKVSETATGKSIECVTDGDIRYAGIDLSAYISNGYIAEMDTTGLASDEGSTVDDATNISFSDNVLTIANFTTGDKLSDIKISKGVVV